MPARNEMDACMQGVLRSRTRRTSGIRLEEIPWAQARHAQITLALSSGVHLPI